MARQNLRNLLLVASLFIAAFLSESPRQHVDARTLQRREVETTTIESGEELTTKQFTTVPSLPTTEVQQIPTVLPTTSEIFTTTVASEFFSMSEESESDSYTSSPHNTNRSLYDELKSTSFYPKLTSPFGNSSPFETTSSTSAEFMKFENMKMEEEESSKSDESSMEKKFKADEFGFRNNVTNEERHTVNEAVFDEETVGYSSKNITNPDDAVKPTAQPVTTTAKKGKYLDLIPRGDDNINASIPNAAEVWALAGMREIEMRKPMDSDETTEIVADRLNSTAKNLLDWTEITKMNNESMTQSSEESLKDLSQTTVHNEINVDEDPATSENKDTIIFVSSRRSTTLKPIIEDNRLESDTGNVEIYEKPKNKSQVATSRIDNDELAKNQDEREESAVELIDPLKKLDGKKKENLKLETTTMSSESFTTETIETTTMENIETTTSIVDSFTVIGDEEEESDDVFKRTITELPPVTTTDSAASQVTTTTSRRAKQSTTIAYEMETTTDIPSQTVNEIPESTHRHKATTPTKSMSTRVVTTEKFTSTESDNESFSSTYVPKFFTTRQQVATTQSYEEIIESSSSPIEIIDDDKFKYSTLLPETTATPVHESKNGELEESTTRTTKIVDSPNRENLDSEQSGSNLGLISALISILALMVLAGGIYFVLKRRNKQNFSQRCRPVGLDAYSLDNVSVYNSVRRKANALRLSKRSYGNSAFEDPSLQSNVLDYQSLQDFSRNKMSIQDEFKEIPQVSVRVDEMPDNCEDKNRYANVVPLPETRVFLSKINDEDKSEYINANYVKGPKDNTNYYIATQAPLENTVADFWRMVWEQNSKVIVMATDLTENGVERCAEYIPASVVLDNSQIFGDFQVTLKSREVKGKYAVSQLHLKNLKTNTWREIMHLWYSWPENGCPNDESSIISLLLEARGYLRTNLQEQLDENSNMESIDKDKLSTLDKTKSLQRVQGPLTIHCSPGTGRTGTLIACDIIIRYLEIPPRQIDIPQIVYTVRRGRANAVRTKDQYEFIYHIANVYATKLNTAPTES